MGALIDTARVVDARSTHAAPPEPALGEPVVVVERLTRVFGERTVLDGLSMTLHAGEIHALLGANGAGKTTLLRILGGLLAPTSGSIAVLGVDVARHPRALRAHVGLVPSGDRTLYLRISGFENLLFFARLYGFPKRAAAERAEELLRQVGLEEAAHRRAGTYSHGMRRRLAIARALLPRPRVLLVDEATHDLDPEGAREIRELVATAAGTGAVTIWATQRLDEVRGFAARATLLAAGTARFAGPVAELLDHAVPRRFVLRLREREGGVERKRLDRALGPLGHVERIQGAADGHVLLEVGDDAVLGDALSAIAAGGVDVLACSPERSELEDAFVSLTRGDA